MDNLPVEILSKIMVDVVNNDSSERAEPYWGPTDQDFSDYWLPIRRANPRIHGPLQLGLVCRHWKQVSEQTAVLWNKFAIDMDVLVDSPDDRILEELESDISHRLALARKTPLHVLVVHTEEPEEPLEDIVFLDIFHELLKTRGQLHSLRMQLPAPYWSMMLSWKGDAPFSTLKYLSITDMSGSPYEQFKAPNYRSLTHLTLDSVPVGHMPRDRMDTSHLTHLRLINSTLELPWDGFLEAQNLQHLVLDSCNTWGRPTALESIQFNNLKHLTYKGPYCPPSFNIMNILQVSSSLEEVVLMEEVVASDYFVPFLSSFGRSIRSFTFRQNQDDRVAPPCNQLVALLALMPSTERLELDYHKVVNSHFDLLFQRLESDNAFLPKLRQIQFNSLHGLSWPLIPSIFEKFLQPDKRPLNHLTVKNMTAFHADRLNEEVINRFSALVDLGLELCLYNKKNKRLLLNELG